MVWQASVNSVSPTEPLHTTAVSFSTSSGYSSVAAFRHAVSHFCLSPRQPTKPTMTTASKTTLRIKLGATTTGRRAGMGEDVTIAAMRRVATSLVVMAWVGVAVAAPWEVTGEAGIELDSNAERVVTGPDFPNE